VTGQEEALFLTNESRLVPPADPATDTPSSPSKSSARKRRTLAPDTKAHAIFLEVSLSSHDWRMIERAILVLGHFKVLPFSPVNPSKESDSGRHEYFWQRQLATFLENALGSVLKKGGEIIAPERWKELEQWRLAVSTYLAERGRRDEEAREKKEEAARKEARREAAKKKEDVVEDEEAKWEEAGLGRTAIEEAGDEEGEDGYDEVPAATGRSSSDEGRPAARFVRARRFDDEDEDEFASRQNVRRFDGPGRRGAHRRSSDRPFAGRRGGNLFDDMAVEDEFDERRFAAGPSGGSPHRSPRQWACPDDGPRGPGRGRYYEGPPRYREGVDGGKIRAGLPRNGESRRRISPPEYIRPVY
jgi:hypothetical protein